MRLGGPRRTERASPPEGTAGRGHRRGTTAPGVGAAARSRPREPPLRRARGLAHRGRRGPGRGRVARLGRAARRRARRRQEPAEFRNLAVSGALTRDVAERQLPRRWRFGRTSPPSLVGVNDTLRCTFDIQAVAGRLDTRVRAARRAAAPCCSPPACPTPAACSGCPCRWPGPLARRQRAVNAVVHALSDRYGAVHLHAAEARLGRRPGHVERRPAAPGRAGAPDDRAALPRAAGRARPRPRDRARPRARAARADAVPRPCCGWPRPGTGWVARRCTDLLPQLLRLAGAEVRHRARGTSARLDRSAEHALSAALAAVSLDVPLARMGE